MSARSLLPLVPLLLGAAAVPPLPLDRAHGIDAIYDRVLERALDAAEARLGASDELYNNHSTWEDPWIVRTARYEVRSAKTRYQAVTVARQLDWVFEQFQYVLGTDWEPPQPLQVWICPSIQKYNEYGQGVDEHSSFYGSFYFVEDSARPVVTFHTDNETLLLIHVVHSATHQFLDQAFQGSPPRWVVEGLASYFSFLFDSNWWITQHEKILQSRPPKMLDILAAESMSDYRSPEETQRRFVELALFFHWLLGVREDTRITAPGEAPTEHSFAEFLRLVVRGKSTGSSGFGTLLRELDVDGLQREFRAASFR